ncbi:hypothetical protein [Ideonella sp. B508-1]|uniref:hypothetical protein n=1 Tax=Ideonella sp. B508-1 TaxID=137716 RepID=UPI00034D8521|nr:hypothetical protein [Ideonella sp. B508-1]
MGFSASDVGPLPQARANLSDLDDHHKLEREHIHLLLIGDAKRGLADIEAGRTVGADAAIARLQQRREGAAMGKTAKTRD